MASEPARHFRRQQRQQIATDGTARTKHADVDHVLAFYRRRHRGRTTCRPAGLDKERDRHPSRRRTPDDVADMSIAEQTIADGYRCRYSNVSQDETTV